MSQGSRNYSVSGDYDPYSYQQGQYDGWQPNDGQSYDDQYYRRDSNMTDSRRDSEADYRRQSNATSRRESEADYRRESNASEIDPEQEKDDYRRGSQPQGMRNTLQPIEEQGGEYYQQPEDYNQQPRDLQWVAEAQWEESHQWEQSHREAYSPGATPRGEKSATSINAALQPDSDSSLPNQQYSHPTQMSATQNREAISGYDPNSSSAKWMASYVSASNAAENSSAANDTLSTGSDVTQSQITVDQHPSGTSSAVGAVQLNGVTKADDAVDRNTKSTSTMSEDSNSATTSTIASSGKVSAGSSSEAGGQDGVKASAGKAGVGTSAGVEDSAKSARLVLSEVPQPTPHGDEGKAAKDSSLGSVSSGLARIVAGGGLNAGASDHETAQDEVAEGAAGQPGSASSTNRNAVRDTLAEAAHSVALPAAPPHPPPPIPITPSSTPQDDAAIAQGSTSSANAENITEIVAGGTTPVTFSPPPPHVSPSASPSTPSDGDTGAQGSPPTHGSGAPRGSEAKTDASRPARASAGPAAGTMAPRRPNPGVGPARPAERAGVSSGSVAKTAPLGVNKGPGGNASGSPSALPTNRPLNALRAGAPPNLAATKVNADSLDRPPFRESQAITAPLQAQYPAENSGDESAKLSGALQNEAHPPKGAEEEAKRTIDSSPIQPQHSNVDTIEQPEALSSVTQIKPAPIAETPQNENRPLSPSANSAQKRSLSSVAAPSNVSRRPPASAGNQSIDQSTKSEGINRPPPHSAAAPQSTSLPPTNTPQNRPRLPGNTSHHSDETSPASNAPIQRDNPATSSAPQRRPPPPSATASQTGSPPSTGTTKSAGHTSQPSAAIAPQNRSTPPTGTPQNRPLGPPSASRPAGPPPGSTVSRPPMKRPSPTATTQRTNAPPPSTSITENGSDTGLDSRWKMLPMPSSTPAPQRTEEAVQDSRWKLLPPFTSGPSPQKVVPNLASNWKLVGIFAPPADASPSPVVVHKRNVRSVGTQTMSTTSMGTQTAGSPRPALRGPPTPQPAGSQAVRRPPPPGGAAPGGAPGPALKAAPPPSSGAPAQKPPQSLSPANGPVRRPSPGPGGSPDPSGVPPRKPSPAPPNGAPYPVRPAAQQGSPGAAPYPADKKVKSVSISAAPPSIIVPKPINPTTRAASVGGSLGIPEPTAENRRASMGAVPARRPSPALPPEIAALVKPPAKTATSAPGSQANAPARQLSPAPPMPDKFRNMPTRKAPPVAAAPS